MASLPERFLCRPESKVPFDGLSMEYQILGNKPSKVLALIDPLDQEFGPQLSWMSYLRSPLILAFKTTLPTVLSYRVFPAHDP